MWISFWPRTYTWWNETILQQSFWFYYLFCLKEEVLVFFHLEKRAGRIIHFHCFMHIQVSTTFPLCLVSYFLFFVGDKRRQKFYSPGCCQTWLACMWPAYVWTSAKNEGNTINSLDCRDCWDVKFVSLLVRVCNRESLFSSYVCNLFLL